LAPRTFAVSEFLRAHGKSPVFPAFGVLTRKIDEPVRAGVEEAREFSVSRLAPNAVLNSGGGSPAG